MKDYNKLNVEQHNAKPDDEGFIVINGLVETVAQLQQRDNSFEKCEERMRTFERYYNSLHGNNKDV